MEGLAEEGAILSIFKYYNVTNTGRISPQELKQVLEDMRIDLTMDEVQKLVEKYDTNKDGGWDLGEFCSFYSKALGEGQISHEDEVTGIFNLLDVDKNQLIDENELRHFFIQISYPLRDDELKVFLQMYDKKGKGGLDYDDFEVFYRDVKNMY